MFTFLTVLIVITSVLLVLVVLAQNSKGGGLASGFTGGSQMMGVKKTTDFIEKLTWGLAIALVVFCLTASITLNSRGGSNNNASTLQEQAEGAKTAPARSPMQQQPAGQPGQARPAAAPAQAAPQPKK